MILLISRGRGLGDTASDAIAATLAALEKSDQQAQASLASTTKAVDRADAIAPDPWTDYAGGMLRGWYRFWGEHGGYTVAPAPNGPGTVGPIPTAAEWAAFDARANELGVAAGTDAARRHILARSSNLLDQVTGSINDALRAFDKTVIQGVAHPVGDALHDLDRYALRPVYKPIAKAIEPVIATLDKVVPGWSVLVDLLAPALPFLPAITNAIAAGAGVSPEVAAQAFGAVNDSLQDLARTVGAPGALPDAVRAASSVVQDELAQTARYVAGVSEQSGQTLAPLQASLAKAVYTFRATEGQLWQKLLATGTEIVQEVGLALSIASAVLTLGSTTPEIASLLAGVEEVLGDASVATTANAAWLAQHGVVTLTLDAASALEKALLVAAQLPALVQATQQLKTAARKARAAAAEEAAALDQEAAELEREIAELRALEAQRAALERARGGSSSSLSPAAKGLALGLGALLVAELFT